MPMRSQRNSEQMSNIQFDRTVPIFRIFDEQKAMEFYIDFLGFALDWEHRFEENFPSMRRFHAPERSCT